LAQGGGDHTLASKPREFSMTAVPEPDVLTHLSASLAGLVAAAAPSIVEVLSHGSSASGFIWKPGLVVTSDETLSEEGDVSVTFSGGERRMAAIAGRDPSTDVAVLRVETGEAPPLALNGAIPETGAIAVTVGGREGLPAAAFGIAAFVGAGWRSVRGGDIDARIELEVSASRRTDGAVAIGADGRPFGMTVIGPRRRLLVIPGVTIARVASELQARGKIVRGYLGLGLQPVRLDAEDGVGAMIMSVDADGPAARAGLHQGDVIVAWDGQAISSVPKMVQWLGRSAVGTRVTLSLRRGGEARTVELGIDERP
jgi:S1-C subfamily serine protease